MMSELLVFVNDEFIPASKASLLVGDLAIQRGYGIFDFCKALHHTPISWMNISIDSHIPLAG